MGRLVFQADQVRLLYMHARGSKHFAKDCDGNEVPGLCLTHDHGIYLTSAGIPWLNDPTDEEKLLCVYAAGCDPSRDADFYEESAHLVGGDDFTEHIPLEDFDKIFAEPGVSTVIIDFDDTQYFLRFTRRTYKEFPTAKYIDDDLEP